jgi:PHD/YefM family antitoxin component YafN of YafNO toxin-antitoxin module
MSIELTEAQRIAINSQGERPARVVDPHDQRAYYLIPASEYEAYKEALEEERRDRAIHAVGLRNAAGRLREEP